MPHPIASLPFDTRRLFAHEVLAAASILKAAIATPVISEPAKALALWMTLVGISPDDVTGHAVADEGDLLFNSLHGTGSFDEPDNTLLRVLVASMRANPDEDAMTQGDIIGLDEADDLFPDVCPVDVGADDFLPRHPAWTPGAI